MMNQLPSPTNDQEVLQQIKANLEGLNKKFERYARPGKFYLFVFFEGMFRGVGTAIGMTIVVAILIAVITKLVAGMVQLPVVGLYIAQLVETVQEYLKQGAAVR